MTIDLPWLDATLRRFAGATARMPHALLLHGPAGVGKRALARRLARQLLCESDEATRPSGGCGACAACLWFGQGNHPDYRLVTSDALAAAAGLEADGDDEERGAAPAAKSKKTPSREIRFEQIRALASFVSVGTHRDGFRVVVIEPLEALNVFGANALLKMLEEPPPRSVFLLVADRIGGIAPTILSRCQRVAIPPPDDATARRWLAARGVADPEAALAVTGGAPLGALAWSADAEAHAAREPLLAFLARPSTDGALALADAFGKTPPAPVIGWMQRWLADALSQKLAGRVRYHPERSGDVAALVRDVDAGVLSALDERLGTARRSADHPLNPRLVYEGLFLDYVDALRKPSA